MSYLADFDKSLGALSSPAARYRPRDDHERSNPGNSSLKRKRSIALRIPLLALQTSKRGVLGRIATSSKNATRLGKHFRDHLATVNDFDGAADAAHVFMVGVDF